MWYNNFLFYYIHSVSFRLCITNYYKCESLKHKSVNLRVSVDQESWYGLAIGFFVKVLPDVSCDFIRDLKSFFKITGRWYNMVLAIVGLKVPHFLAVNWRPFSAPRECHHVSPTWSLNMPSHIAA